MIVIDRWWRSLSDTEKAAFRNEVDALVAGFADTSTRELPAEHEGPPDAAHTVTIS